MKRFNMGAWERRASVIAIVAAIVWSAHVVSNRKPVAATDRAVDNPALRSAASLQEAFVEVARTSEPSVVNIQVERANAADRRARSIPPEDFFDNPFEGQPFRDFFREFGIPPFRPQASISQGSGFIFDEAGYILTNNHVVEGAGKIKVVLLDKRQFQGKVIGRDPRLDLAVIQIKGDNLAPATLGNSDNIHVGEWAIAVGNPFGLDHTLTVGVISAKGRELDVVSGRPTAQDFIQTDAAINPGNSGGPLLNIYAEVIGINNSIYSTSGGNNGIGFAIPINNAKAVLRQLIEKGKVTRGWLGISIQPLQPEMTRSLNLPEGTKGVLVGEVTADSPADKAGLKAGDVITQFGSRKTETPRDLQRQVAATQVGEEVNVRLWRNGSEITLRVRIGEMPGDTESRAQPQSLPSQERSPAMWRGLSVQPLTPDIARQLSLRHTRGVVVIGVEPGSAAEDAGLARGDVILKIGKQEIASLSDFRAAVKAVAKSEGAMLWVYRGGHSRFVLLQPET